MKIIIEGDLAELRPILKLLMAEEATTSMLVPQPLSNLDSPSEQISSPSATVVEVAPEVTRPLENDQRPTIIDSVYHFIEKYPGATTDRITTLSGLEHGQVRRALKSLRRGGRVARMTDRTGLEATPSFWLPADIAQKGRGISEAIRSYIRQNPGHTSRDIAQNTGIPYKRITSMMNSLAQTKYLRIEGNGGITDPFRYYVS